VESLKYHRKKSLQQEGKSCEVKSLQGKSLKYHVERYLKRKAQMQVHGGAWAGTGVKQGAGKEGKRDTGCGHEARCGRVRWGEAQAKSEGKARTEAMRRA
jgi:hypothetical protein